MARRERGRDTPDEGERPKSGGEPNSAHDPPGLAQEPPDPADEPPNPADEPPNPADEPPDPAGEPPALAGEPPDPADEPPDPAGEPPDPPDEPPEPADEPMVGGDMIGGDQQEIDWDEMLTQLARQPLEEGWVTLDEASDAAGVSRSTLRSWYRSGQIPSRMVAGVHGPQRLVPLEAVIDRALRSARARRQLEHARSLEAEVAELRRRVEALERHLGLG